MRSLTDNSSARHFNWSFPPESCVLSDEEVHVWVAELEQPDFCSKELAQTLSSDENERASRFHFKQDRKNFVMARGFLRKILCCYAETPADQLKFSYGKNGKPSLRQSSAAENLNFNVSHSGGLALYAITKNRDIGIDLEKITPCSDMDAIAGQVFFTEERNALKFLESPHKEENFFRYWTRKEAQLKCTGEGFSSELENETRFEGSVLELEPAEGFIATLAVRGKPFFLKTWQWRPAQLAEA